MKKKVLIVILSLYNGGAEKSLVNMLNELPEDRFDVDLLLFRKSGIFLQQVPSWVNILDTPDNLRKLYSPVLKSGNMMFCKTWGTLMARLNESTPLMREGYRWEKFYSKKAESLPQKYDVAIAYTSSEIMFYVGDKVQADKKIVWIHNDFRSANHAKKYSYKYFEEMELVTISEECARIVEEEFSKLNKKVHNIPNITSSEVVKKRADEFMPEEYSSDDFNILSIGRFSEQKGFDFAIDAAEILKNQNVNFKWYVIGDGELHDDLVQRIKKKGLTDQFLLIGTRENPYPYIKNCDLFAQTSRYEGKSVAIDEAKILGIPIIVTNYPTVHDQIRDNEEGCIVEMNPASIAEGIKRLIDDRDLRSSLSQYLKSRDYGNQEEIEKYISLIEE